MKSTPVIADSGFWIALFNRNDAHHPRAVDILGTLDRRLVPPGRCSLKPVTCCCVAAASQRSVASSRVG